MTQAPVGFARRGLLYAPIRRPCIVAAMAELSPAPQRSWQTVAILSLAVFVIAVVYLKLSGRVWWCACRTPTPFSIHVFSSHNSQHLLDPYSFSHLLHGLIFYFVLRAVFPRMPYPWVLFLGLVIETSWEMLENSPAVIERYRAATASLGYSGDSVVNTLGDIVSCLAGVVLARRIGLWWSIAVFFAVELTLLVLIRDNLILNVLMLLSPVESIRQWQLQVVSATQPI
jgi:hypothetical protein